MATLKVDIGADISQLRSEMQKAQGVIGGLDSSVKNAAGSIKNAFIGAFAGIGIAKLGGEIINVTSSFQKFEAVLTNTLGSASAAARGMQMISSFAASTPFQVDELTSSFVKLANQGFIPTQEEMRKLGDLASAMGKGFDQLTEAIIDAQTGEFERLKEFGIRASKQGDQVTFSFKGVETQTKFTASSIREYVLSLGDAIGVSGGMEKISQTLGGQISNTKDAWDNLLRTIGDGNSGILATTVNKIQDLISSLTFLIETSEQVAKKTSIQNQNAGLENFKAFATAYKDIKQAQEIFINDTKREISVLEAKEAVIQKAGTQTQFTAAEKELYEQAIKTVDLDRDRLARLRDQVTAVNEYVAAYKPKVDAEKQSTAELKKQAEHLKLMRQDAIDSSKTRVDGPNALQVKAGKGSKDISTAPLLPDLQPNIEQLRTLNLTMDQYMDKTRNMQDAVIDLTGVIVSGLTNAFVSLGNAIGQAMAGVDVNFGDVILKTIAGFAQSVGEMLIAAGTTIAVAQTQIVSNPYAAIAAGVALVAIAGAVMGSISSSAANMGGGGGGGNGASARAIDNYFKDREKINQTSFPNSINITGLVGNVLTASIRKSAYSTSYTGG